MVLKRYCCAVLPVFVACATPTTSGGNGGNGSTPTEVFCSAAPCPTLTSVGAEQSFTLQGNAIKHADNTGVGGNVPQNAQVAVTTDWRQVGEPAAAGVFSMSAATLAADPVTEIVLGAEADVRNYVYQPVTELGSDAGSYEFVQAFRVRAGNNMSDPLIYEGYHGFVPTMTALMTATGTVTYTGGVFGQIASMTLVNSENPVDVGGGTATMVANFGMNTASLTLAFQAAATAPLLMDLELEYTGLAIDRAAGRFGVNPMGGTTLAVTVAGSSGASLFSTMPVGGGVFYGWNADSAAPAEIGGGVALMPAMGTMNSANLLFLGKIGTTTMPMPMPPTELSCSAQVCPTLSAVMENRIISLVGNGLKRMAMEDDPSRPVGANTPVAFTTTDWRLTGELEALRAFSFTASAGTAEDRVEITGRSSGTYRYTLVSRVMTDHYDFVELFRVVDSINRVFYEGYHGFAPTVTALGMVSGTVNYRGEAVGQIFSTTVLGPGASDQRDVSGGTATMVADFGMDTATLTLKFESADPKTGGEFAGDLEIEYAGLVIDANGNFAPDSSTMLTVKFNNIDSPTAFDLPTASVDGRFYGWSRDRSAPANIGGRFSVGQIDQANSANLLFVGAIGSIAAGCDASSCSNIAGLSAPTNLDGTAVKLGDQSHFTTMANYRPETQMGKVRYITGTTYASSPQEMETFVDLDDMQNSNSYTALTGDFDGDPATDATEMTGGYDFVRAYAVSDSAPMELYRGFHGIPYDTVPDSGNASYSGRFLMDDGAGWFGAEVASNFVVLNFQGGVILLNLSIPGNSIPDDRAFGLGSSTGLSVTMGRDAQRGFFFVQRTPHMSPDGTASEVSALARGYGYDPNAFGAGKSGPDEMAGVVTYTGTGTDAGKDLTVLFVAD